MATGCWPVPGRLAHEPLVLTSSGSALSMGVPLGPALNSMAGSRNLWTTSDSLRTMPSSASGCFIWAQTSLKIWSRVHWRAVLP